MMELKDTLPFPSWLEKYLHRIIFLLRDQHPKLQKYSSAVRIGPTHYFPPFWMDLDWFWFSHSCRFGGQPGSQDSAPERWRGHHASVSSREFPCLLYAGAVGPWLPGQDNTNLMWPVPQPWRQCGASGTSGIVASTTAMSPQSAGWCHNQGLIMTSLCTLCPQAMFTLLNHFMRIKRPIEHYSILIQAWHHNNQEMCHINICAFRV